MEAMGETVWHKHTHFIQEMTGGRVYFVNDEPMTNEGAGSQSG